MSPKHAYLIIAHTEFEVLQLLINALDSADNDIYVHIDKKIRQLPELHSIQSSLYVLDKRIDVRWGDISQIKTELLLYETALRNGPYCFYHMISGNHLPLKSISEIQSFYSKHIGKCLFGNLEKRDRDYQEILKMHRLNFCTRTYSSSISQFVWKALIKIQKIWRISINNNIQFYWAYNWCSLSQEAVEYLVSHKKQIVKRYRWSFCGDEWYKPTELMASPISKKVNKCNEQLYVNMGRANAQILDISDFDKMQASNCLFARKFSKQHSEPLFSLMERTINNYRNNT